MLKQATIEEEVARLRQALNDADEGGMSTDEIDEVEAGIDALRWVLGEFDPLDLPRGFAAGAA
jgi:hypothetical protein